MRLFCLEVKRIIMSRRTLVLIAVAILMSVISAYLPISFESIDRPGENGEVIELDGVPAIKFKRDYYAKTAGDITSEKLAEALRVYQSCVKEYGTLDDEEIQSMKKQLLSIAADGKIDESEREEFDGIMRNLDSLAKTISELRMLAEKITERSGGNGTR